MDREGLLGRRFGHLTVIEDSGQRKGNSILWRCRCDCGKETLAVRHQLVSGTLQNCGCLPGPRLPKTTDLIGRRFGMLTVAEDSGLRTDSGVIRWRCKCDCGSETLATRRQLVSGNVTNCGCVPKQYASKRQAEDLTGRQFGELTALHRVENDKHNRVCWACRCSCGNEIIVQAMLLKSGKTRSCGCKRHATSYNKCDLTGQHFGRLTVLFRSERNGTPAIGYWHCRCDCGKEVDVFSGSLLRGLTQSCGCWNREQSAKMHEHMHYQDDTCIEMLKWACKDKGRNKAGFRGLFQLPNGKYRAAITFQGKHYDLGHYTSFDQAVQARLDAERILHMGYISAYERYEQKARTDPGWAESNPFFYRVARTNGSFHVQTNG